MTFACSHRSLLRRLSVRAALTKAALSAMLASPVIAQLTGDPFDAPVPLGIVEATLEPFVSVPNSNGLPARMQGIFSAYDGTGRLWVVDQRGPIYTVSSDGSTIVEFLDVRDVDPQLTGTFEGGVQSIAFHPRFETNGRFYTIHGTFNTSVTPTYSVSAFGISPQLQQVVLEWTATDPSLDVFAGSPPRDIMRYDQPDGNHYGGGLTFDYSAPLGETNFELLFITIGDGTGAGDSFGLGQNPLAINGTILRINPDEQFGGAPYGVPSDNPFVNDASMLDEIYAFGFRNPQRISFDIAREITDPIAIDIGQGVVEEVNVVTAGDNFGWGEREGSFEFINNSTVRINPTPPGLIPPVAEYDHSEGRAITGGSIGRGPESGALEGAYLFGDLNNGRIFYVAGFVSYLQGATGGQDAILELRLRDDSGAVTTFIDDLAGNQSRADLRLGVSESGELFATNKREGTVRRLTNIIAVLPCSNADLADPLGVLDAFDASAFADALAAGDSVADFVSGGGLNLVDVNAFNASLAGGCMLD